MRSQVLSQCSVAEFARVGCMVCFGAPSEYRWASMYYLRPPSYAGQPAFVLLLVMLGPACGVIASAALPAVLGTPDEGHAVTQEPVNYECLRSSTSTMKTSTGIGTITTGRLK